MGAPSYDELVKLLGKRSDDPEILAFHKARRLKPAVVQELDTRYPIKDEKGCFWLNYTATVRLPGYYPPRRENGVYVGYLSSISLRKGFAGRVAGAFDLSLTLKQAKAKAIDSSSGLFTAFVLARDALHELEFLYDDDDKSFHHAEVSLVELDKGDPALEKLVAPAAPARAIPKRGAPGPEPLPPALAALSALAKEEGLGEIDLELLDRIDVGRPTAWTGNAEAEKELRVFAEDGTGGLVAFWLVNEGALEAQPIVFLGSEGKVGAVAKDLADFVGLLAQGIGPYELVEIGTTEGDEPVRAVAKLLKKHFGTKPRPIAQIAAEASAGFGDIVDRVKALTKR